MNAAGNRFLLVRLGALGDVVHAIPVAAALRARYPDARIDWLIDPRYVELVGLVRAVDRTIGIDTRASRRTVITTVRDLRRQQYTAAIDLQGLMKSAILARAAGARQTIGFSRRHLREPLAGVCYTTRVTPGSATHVIHQNLSLLEPLGIRTDRVEFPIAVPRTPALAPAVVARGFVLINAGAAWPNKRWPVERFGALAVQLHDRLGLGSVVLWGPGEERQAADVVAAAHGAAMLAPPTTTTGILALASTARLMVSGDTGPLHLAAAVGTPVVGIFGPTRPERNGPWLPADICVSRFEQCACHYERRCRRPSRCLDDISVDEVVSAAERRVLPLLDTLKD